MEAAERLTGSAASWPLRRNWARWTWRLSGDSSNPIEATGVVPSHPRLLRVCVTGLPKLAISSFAGRSPSRPPVPLNHLLSRGGILRKSHGTTSLKQTSQNFFLKLLKTKYGVTQPG